MAHLAVKNVAIKGIAAAVPHARESNHAYPFASEKEKDLFIKTTGISERRKASADLLASDLCCNAAETLIAKLGWDKTEIELLVFVSQSRDYIIPSTATILQDRLQLPKSCLCFDVPLGCSGYVYGLSILASLMSSGQIKKGLLLAGDTSSFSVNPNDKSTYPLFGDAGSATAVAWEEEAPDLFFELGSDGAGHQHIIIPGGHCRKPIAPESFTDQPIAPGIERNQLNLALNGEEVFYFSVTQVPVAVKSLLDFCGKEMNALDFWIMHQANKLMNETIRMKCKFAPEKVPYSLDLFGNTSSASIPLTLVTTANTASFQDKTLLLSGFGVGLSWANLVVQTKDLLITELIEM